MKSVKLDRCGRRMIAASSGFLPSRISRRWLRESSSSMSTFRYGTTPTTGRWVFSSSIERPGRRISTSPRNLLMTSPLMRRRSFSSSSSTVPYSWANTPPRSMSPTRSTGASTISARPMFTMSSLLRLISAGLPAPSMTMTSASSARLSYAFRMSGTSCRFVRKYSDAFIWPRTSPLTMT